MRAAQPVRMLERSLILGSLFAIACLGARLINTLIGSSLAPSIELPPLQTEEKEPESLAPLSAFLERNLFGAARGTPPIDPASCERGTLSARLVATVIGEEDAVAWFEAGGDRLRAVFVGDRLDGAEVIAVERGAVRFSRDGACGEVPLDDRAVLRAERKVPSSLRRSDLEAAIADPMRFGRDVRIVPKPSQHGFALVAIRSGGIFDQLGFQNGDVVQRINGHRLDEPGKLMGLMDLLHQPELSIDLLRRGAPHTISYRLE